MTLIAEPARFETWLRRARAIWMTLQRDLRDAEPGQILLCAIMGCVIGAIVDLMREGVAWLHVFDFGIPANRYLSEGVGVSRTRLLFVPLLGGLLLGLAARAVRAKRLNEIVDPIEANALHGGRMSLRDSLWLTLPRSFPTVPVPRSAWKRDTASWARAFIPGWGAGSGCAARICACS